jgi:hypothetical protein
MAQRVKGVSVEGDHSVGDANNMESPKERLSITCPFFGLERVIGSSYKKFRHTKDPCCGLSASGASTCIPFEERRIAGWNHCHRRNLPRLVRFVLERYNFPENEPLHSQSPHCSQPSSWRENLLDAIRKEVGTKAVTSA